METDGKILTERAREAMAGAYAPYSGFFVGAALLCSSGRIYTGCNIENASYGATVCAERVALFKAVSEGELEFRGLAVVSSGQGATAPCGLCRQVLAEFSADMPVWYSGAEGEIRETSLGYLLPDSQIRLGKG